MRRVETPQLVCQTYSCLPSLLWNFTSKALPKFWPRSCEVPACSALPSCIMASMVYEASAPANFSLSLLRPRITGMAMNSRAKSAYTPSICITSATASSWVECAVWPSCQRNSLVRRNMRVRSSQRMTLAHWLMSSGRSRYD